MDTEASLASLSGAEKELLEGLKKSLREQQAERRSTFTIDEDRVVEAFLFACAHHVDQRRKSGEAFIIHPVAAAEICAQLRLDTETICAALLHDTVEDTSASLTEVQKQFGEEISSLVDGVTKLTGMTFQSTDEAQAENYRKMIVAMASDVRVILVKLADRLHNMRTISALKKPKQVEKAKETLDIYAPIAHRLGIHALKWELEDLAFATLHPRKYSEVKDLVNQQRTEREGYIEQAGQELQAELKTIGIQAQISGRAKHFYSIYVKMAKKGKEFNEIYDLTAMRVIVDSVKDCYGAVGAIHTLWTPLPGRFKDYIAMPKLNMYQSLHTTVVGPEGRPLEIQIRTEEMHAMAEFGVAAHWSYKEGAKSQPELNHKERLTWLKTMLDWQQELTDPREFMETLKGNLVEDQVYVFTPKGDVKSLPQGSTPLDFAYEVHTEIGHRCVGARVNGKIVPLHYTLKSGDIVEVLTAKRERGPSRDWLAVVRTSRARNKIKQWFRASSRADAEHNGREILQEQLRKQGLPAQRIAGSAMLIETMNEMGFAKLTEFYIALGEGKVSSAVVVNKIVQHLKQGAPVGNQTSAAEDLLAARDRSSRKTSRTSSEYGVSVEGASDVMVRMAKCCRPVPGDAIVGYISLGRGITVHRAECPNVQALKRSPERFTEVHWIGENKASFRVELQISAWDRPRLLEDLSRLFAEQGVNIIEARCTTDVPVVRAVFVVEIIHASDVKNIISRLLSVDSVFDAYRVTPGSA